MVLYRKIFRCKGDSKEEDICSMCLDKYKYWEKCASTTCKHNFHLKCFNLWFTDNDKCPICRWDCTKTYKEHRESFKRPISKIIWYKLLFSAITIGFISYVSK